MNPFTRHPSIVGALALTLLLICITGIATAQVTISANKIVADGKLVPVLTWTSSPVLDGTCNATGAWSGVKAGSGTETLPEITASKTYGLTCSWPSQSGSATINWTAPTTNTDGTPLTNLASYEVVAGTNPDALTRVSTALPTATSKLITGLSGGTWYFGVMAVTSSDVRSALSNVISKPVGAPPFSASGSVTITIRPVPSAPVLTTVVVAGVNFVPLYRVSPTNQLSKVIYGLIPVGRTCGAYVTTWRGLKFHRVTVSAKEVWGTTSTADLAAPCNG